MDVHIAPLGEGDSVAMIHSALLGGIIEKAYLVVPTLPRVARVLGWQQLR